MIIIITATAVCELWTFRIRTWNANHIVQMFGVMGELCRGLHLKYCSEVRLQGQGKSTKILWPRFEPGILRMRIIRSTVVLYAFFALSMGHTRGFVFICMRYRLRGDKCVWFLSLHLSFLLYENFDKRKITESCICYMSICQSDVTSGLIRSMCAVFVFVMAYGRIHGSGNTARPHTHCLSVSSFSCWVCPLSGDFNAH
jgi:hypothetical protein